MFKSDINKFEIYPKLTISMKLRKILIDIGIQIKMSKIIKAKKFFLNKASGRKKYNKFLNR